MSGPLLEMREVGKSFGASRALDGVSLALEGGEVHALIGEKVDQLGAQRVEVIVPVVGVGKRKGLAVITIDR